MYKNLQIREVSAVDDKDFYLKCFSHPKWISLYDLSFGNSKIDQETHIQQKISGQYSNLYRLLAYNNKTSRKVGFAHILVDDEISKRCTLTGGTDPDLMGKGYGSVILYLFLNFIFKEIKMNKVSCYVYNFNSSSFNLLDSSGLKLEGILRQHSFDYISQKFIDVKIYSMLSSEFLQSRLANSLVNYL